MWQKIIKIWKNKHKILEGIRYTWFPTSYVETIAQRRLAICRTNSCGLYDAKGEAAICVKKGEGCCSGCGCNDVYKAHSLSSYCTLKDLGKTPLWGAELSESEERDFRTRSGIRHE